MATPSLSNFVTSVTEQEYFPVVVDNFYAGNVLFMRLRNKKKMWSSGYQIKIPTQVLGRTALGSYSGGDTFSTAQEDVRQQFTVNPAQYYANITITGIQLAANRGRRAVVDLLDAEMGSVSTALQQQLGTDLYGDGTGNSNRALSGLIAQVDDGTNIVVFQGLSRTTYPTLKSVYNVQSGALGLDDLATDWDGAQVGSDQPTLGLTTPAIFSIVEALFTANLRYMTAQQAPRVSLTAAGVENAGVVGLAGFTGILFRGMPIVTDDKATSGNLYMLNEKYIDLYEMEPAPSAAGARMDGFSWTGWKKPSNQDVIISQFLWYGQLIGTEPRKHSRRVSITS